MSEQRRLAFAPAVEWTPSAPPDLSRFPEIELDGEFASLNPRVDDLVGLAVGTPAGTQYLPFRHRGGQNLDEAVVKRWAQTELKGKRIRNLHTKIDLHKMISWGVDLREQGCAFRDVAHQAALLDDHRKRFNLNALAWEELKRTKVELDPLTIADLPAGAVEAYARQDVDLVRCLGEVYDTRIVAEDLGRVQALEDAVIPVVVEMERNGAPLDLDLLARWRESAKALSERLAFELYRAAGFQVNPDSSKDMARLFRQCGAEYGLTETGAPSFTAPIVQAAAEHHPAIQLAWRIGKLNDLRNKYLDKYWDEHEGGVLYPSFNQLPTDEGGTVSGRFSCVRPNLQQVMGKDKHKRLYGWLLEYGPEDYLIKRLFRSSSPWTTADMAQCEYRIFVHYTRSARLLKFYQDNPRTDFHQVTHGFVNAVYPDITRTETKICSFTIMYGGGIGATARNLRVSDAVAEPILNGYHAQFPEMKRLLYECKDVAERRGYVRTKLGRRSRFPNGERSHKALNAVIQGTAADANKAALVDVYRERKEIGLTMRLTVHDSLEGTGEVDQKKLTEVLERDRLGLSVPLLWEVSSGANWAEAK